jgi:hypothetical protein
VDTCTSRKSQEAKSFIEGSFGESQKVMTDRHSFLATASHSEYCLLKRYVP